MHRFLFAAAGTSHGVPDEVMDLLTKKVVGVTLMVFVQYRVGQRAAGRGRNAEGFVGSWRFAGCVV